MFRKWNNKLLPEGVKNIDLIEFPYPFEDESVEAIVVSHCLNQISKSYYIRIFGEFFRVLNYEGVLRVTDDNNDFFDIHIHAATYLNEKIIMGYMSDCRFYSKVVGSTETVFEDKSILVNNHVSLGTGRFFVEGIKYPVV